jgi:hypothetical protein
MIPDAVWPPQAKLQLIRSKGRYVLPQQARATVGAICFNSGLTQRDSLFPGRVRRRQLLPVVHRA